MKPAVYSFVILVLFCLSCNKDKTPTCSSGLLAFRQGTDTGLMIGVDPNSGQGVTGFYNNLNIKQSIGKEGALNTRDNCYYILQVDDMGKICLLRFNLRTKKTDLLPYSGSFTALRLSYSPLFYSSVTNTLYCLYNSANGQVIYELVLNGNTYTEREVLPPVSSSHISLPAVDENTRNIYYTIYSEPGRTNEKIRMVNPATKTSVDIATVNTMENLHFGKNNKMLYATQRSLIAGYRRQDLVKIDPKDGSTTFIRTIASDYSTGLYQIYSSCYNDTLILLIKNAWSAYADNRICWVDLKTESIIREVYTVDNYWGLTYVPCQ